MKYRVQGIVEAEQFVSKEELPDGVRRMGPDKFFLDNPLDGVEGQIIHLTDYACRGEDGGTWPCSVEMFTDTYEVVSG